MTDIINNLPQDDYFAHPGINCSGLKQILRSPMHYKASLEQPFKETNAMQIGSAVHCAILEPNRFYFDYTIAPAGLDKRTKEGKSQWADLVASGKIILSSDEAASISDMAEAVKAHPTASRLLAQGSAEVSVFTEIDGIPAKARIDWLIPGSAIVDLKTTDDASPEGFARSVAKYGYDMQAAWYLDCAEQAELGVGDNFIFIAVEKSPPYAIGIYALDAASVQVGRAKCRKALNMYRYCTEYNDWFGYSPDLITLSLPRWALNEEKA